MSALSRKRPGVRWGVAGLCACAAWVIVAVKGTDLAYYFAVGATVSLLQEGTRRWARSKGLPEWSANEAYIARLRRWRRSRETIG
jgi:hypothetical protein